MYSYLKENISAVRERVSSAGVRAGADTDSVNIVAVSKTFPADIVKAAVGYGLNDLGESRLQDARPKIEELGNIAIWHMIGHLQTNKVKKAVELFSMIQSVDSIHLANEIELRAAKTDKIIDCLLEVNSSGEKAKYGIHPDEIPETLAKLKDYGHIRIRGLMTIGPFVDDDKLIRYAFRMTRRLFEDARGQMRDKFNTLSMGMSSDFELAIEEGSNMVRIGTAIFGQRKKR